MGLYSFLAPLAQTPCLEFKSLGCHSIFFFGINLGLYKLSNLFLTRNSHSLSCIAVCLHFTAYYHPERAGCQTTEFKFCLRGKTSYATCSNSYARWYFSYFRGKDKPADACLQVLRVLEHETQKSEVACYSSQKMVQYQDAVSSLCTDLRAVSRGDNHTDDTSWY